jgi:ubiquinone/menaquinone biosynthesis C-methylase UbiE
MKEKALAQFFYKYALAYEALNHIVHFPDLKKKRMDKLQVGPDDGRVLELGCGTGVSSKIFNEKNVISIHLDINEKFVRYGKKKKRFINGVVGTAYNLCFPDRTFDKIIFADAFHHVLDHERLFQECNRVLKPGGTFIVFDIVHKISAPNVIINHFADGMIWILDRRAFESRVARLAAQNDFVKCDFSWTQEKTLVGIVFKGIDIQAKMIKAG